MASAFLVPGGAEMSVYRWPVVLCLFLAVPLGSRTLHAEPQASSQARAYFRNGVELLQSDPPNYGDAYYQFKLAYDASKSWKVLGNLGLCALKLERDGEALEYYTEYLKRGGDQVDGDEREAIERDMLLIRGNTSEVEIEVPQPPTEITDLHSGSKLPPQSYTVDGASKKLVVRAGSHAFTATRADGRKLTWEVVLTPGKSVTHRFDFDAPTMPEPAPEPAAQPARLETRAVHPTSKPAPLLGPGYVTLGVGVLALGASVVTGLLAKSKEAAALDGCNRDTKVCDPSAEAKFDSASSLAKVTNVLLIGGAALTAVGGGLVIFSGSAGGPVAQHAYLRPSPRASLRLVPVVSFDASAVFASGSF